MRFISFILLIVFSLVLQTNAQTKRVSNKLKTQVVSIKLLKDKPSVYITFEKYGVFTSDRTKQTYRIVWFRLHNNLRENISFCYYDLSVSPTGEIGVHYQVEKHLSFSDPSSRNNEAVSLGFPGYDVCDSYKLESGKSFLFGVPRSDLITDTQLDTQLKVQFFYPWENAFESLTGGEPQHYVYFRTLTLPKEKE